MESFQRIGFWYLIIHFIDINCFLKIDVNNKSDKYVENNNNNNISQNYDTNIVFLDSWEKDEDFWCCESIIDTILVRICMFSFFLFFFVIILLFVLFVLFD